MKKTQWVALFQDIKATAVSFLSILLFVALGIAVFLGIKWNEPALANTTTAYYDAHRFQDFLLNFQYGLTPEDVRAVQALDAVADAEGAYSAHGTAVVNKNQYVLIVQSLTQRVNSVTLLEGLLPAAPDEIGIEAQFAETAGLTLGDTIKIDTGSGDNTLLINADFTVTAIVEHPAYIRPESHTRGLSNIGDGVVDYYAVTPASAFNTSAFDNCFSQIVVRGVGLSGINTFSDAYDARAGEVAEAIKTLGAERASLRCDEVYRRYQREIESGEARIKEAGNELSDGKKKLEEGRETLRLGEQSIATAETEIAANRKILAAAEEKYAAGKAEYDRNAAKLATAYQKLKRVLRNAGFYTDLDAASAQVGSALTNLYDMRTEVAELKTLLEEATSLLAKYKQSGLSVMSEKEVTKLVYSLSQAG